MITRNWRQNVRSAQANMKKLEHTAGKAQANMRQMADAYYEAKAIGPRILNAHMTTITGGSSARKSVQESFEDPGMTTQERLDEIESNSQPTDLSSPFRLNAMSQNLDHFQRESGYNTLKAGMDRSVTRASAAIIHERQKIREGHFPFLLAGVILLIVILVVDSFFVTFLQTWMRIALVLMIVGCIVWKFTSKKSDPTPNDA